MTDYKAMYLLLFNAITDALEKIEEQNYGEACELLIAAQQKAKSEAVPVVQSAELPSEAASVPQTVQDAPAETADVMPETAAPDNVREAAAAVGETDSYENAPLRETLGLRPEAGGRGAAGAGRLAGDGQGSRDHQQKYAGQGGR